ncbi:MAG: hypothetical protein ABII09_01780 [Planctomycetota bacterium]
MFSKPVIFNFYNHRTGDKYTTTAVPAYSVAGSVFHIVAGKALTDYQTSAVTTPDDQIAFLNESGLQSSGGTTLGLSPNRRRLAALRGLWQPLLIPLN